MEVTCYYTFVYVLAVMQAIVLASGARKLQNYFSLNFPLQPKIEVVRIKYLQYVHAWTEVYTALNHLALFCHISVERSIVCEDFNTRRSSLAVKTKCYLPFPPWVCFLVGFFSVSDSYMISRNTQIHFHSWWSIELETRKSVATI